MKLQCAPACQTCDQLDFETRCPFDRNAPLVWQPGDLNAMFERITTDPFYQKYTPQIHSQPPKGPWVLVLDNVVSEKDCTQLMDLGGVLGYEISKDVGEKKFDGSFEGYTNTRRTSTNAVRAYYIHSPYCFHLYTIMFVSTLGRTKFISTVLLLLAILTLTFVSIYSGASMTVMTIQRPRMYWRPWKILRASPRPMESICNF